MIRVSRNPKGIAGRRGAVLVQVAIMLVALTVFVALAVDVGVIATARAQLKTVADSAALAGARQLASDRRISTTITDLTPEMNAATAEAMSAGYANTVLGHSPILYSSDIVIGYKNVTAPNADPPDAAVSTGGSPLQFNSVQVTASANIPALFSATFRPNGSTVSVTSTATVELAQIKGFAIGTANTSILPIVMDLAGYTRMTQGLGADSYTFSSSGYNPPSSNGVSNGSDGVTESIAYPVAAQSGNWGTIKFGVSNSSTATLNSQITYGITPAEMLAEYPDGTNTVSIPHQFSANPGISAGIKGNLNGIIGQAVTVPIYSSSGGSGSNAWYQVTSFASVRVVAVNMTGNPKYVVVQPALSVDPSAIPNTGGVMNTWSQGGVVFLHLSR